MKPKTFHLSHGLNERDLIIYGLWVVSDLTQREIGKIYGITHQRVSQIVARHSQTTNRKKGYQIISQIVAGLFLMINDQDNFLCWNPNDSDRAAREMWRVHTDDRLREIISLRLVTPDVDVTD